MCGMSLVCGGLVRRIPLVVIVGATGTGKTRLGVELARAFPAEIISADSMQVYRGLDVVTAKPTPDERAAAPHHLVDFLEPPLSFTVLDFRNRALPIIDNLVKKGKMAIIVGGTHYYVESILWKILVEEVDDSELLMCERDEPRAKQIKLDIADKGEKCVASAEVAADPNNYDLHNQEGDTGRDKAEGGTADGMESISDDTRARMRSMHSSDNNMIQTLDDSGKVNVVEVEGKEKAVEVRNKKKKDGAMEVDRELVRRIVESKGSGDSSAEVYACLQAVDPVMASRLHPNNTRKILRALEVWLHSGQRQSDLLAAQAERERQLRYGDDTIVLWLTCDQAVHDARLEKRVDGMVAAGLVQEMLDYHERYNRGRINGDGPPDYTKGIFQTLGFKEFHEYLVLEPAARAGEEGERLLARGLHDMKLGTRRYARRQHKMVRSRFLEHPTREIPHIYALNTTDLSRWDENVKNKAIAIVRSFTEGVACPHEPLMPSAQASSWSPADIHAHNRCEPCGRVFIGDVQFRLHLASNKHRRVLRRLQK